VKNAKRIMKNVHHAKKVMKNAHIAERIIRNVQNVKNMAGIMKVDVLVAAKIAKKNSIE